MAPFLFSLRRFFLVGQTPWSARDAPVPLFLRTEGLPDPNGPTRGSAADQGVRPTINEEQLIDATFHWTHRLSPFWLRLCCSCGQPILGKIARPTNKVRQASL